MTQPMTLADMQAVAADLYLRCKPRGGYVATSATITLSPDDIEALDAIARFLALAAPNEAQINRVINGGRHG